MEFVFYSKCMLMLEQVFWSSRSIISCERQTANQMYPISPTLLYGWLLVTRVCLEGIPVFNLQLVLASRSIISKRWIFLPLKAAFEWQISFTKQLLLSCFIYHTGVQFPPWSFRYRNRSHCPCTLFISPFLLIYWILLCSFPICLFWFVTQETEEIYFC